MHIPDAFLCLKSLLCDFVGANGFKRKTIISYITLFAPFQSLPLELEQNGMLQILDMGHNYLRQWSDIQVKGQRNNLSFINIFHGEYVIPVISHCLESNFSISCEYMILFNAIKCRSLAVCTN
jgi:hypothetical protein